MRSQLHSAVRKQVKVARILVWFPVQTLFVKALSQQFPATSTQFWRTDCKIDLGGGSLTVGHKAQDNNGDESLRNAQRQRKVKGHFVLVDLVEDWNS
jgi:hypothetical protein